MEEKTSVFSVTPGEKITIVHVTGKRTAEMNVVVQGTLHAALKAMKKKGVALSRKASAALSHPSLSEGMVRSLVVGQVPKTNRFVVLGSTYGVKTEKGRQVYSLGSIHHLIQPLERTVLAKKLVARIVREAFPARQVLFPKIVARK